MALLTIIFGGTTHRFAIAGFLYLYYYQLAAVKVGIGLEQAELKQSQLNWIADFIWGISGDVLRDLYARDNIVMLFFSDNRTVADPFGELIH